MCAAGLCPGSLQEEVDRVGEQVPQVDTELDQGQQQPRRHHPTVHTTVQHRTVEHHLFLR